MKTRTIVSFLLAILSVQAFSATYYAKPTACGNADGSDWDNAMTFAAALTAATGANNGSEVRLAQGVYAKSSFYDGSYTLSITGGWRGESGTDATRDVDLYETIVLPTATIPTWEHLTPTWVDGQPSFTAEATGLPVVADGKVSLPPAYTGATDTYRITGASSNTGRPFMLRGGVLTVDGLWFVGWNVGTLCHNFGGTGHAFANCRFVGFLVNGTGDNGRAGVFNTRGMSSVTGCKFLFVYGTAVCSALNVNASGLTISDCTFEGCSRFGGSYAGGNVITASDPVTVTGCTFRRCHELSLREGQKQGLDGVNVNTGNIYGSSGGTTSGLTLTDSSVCECYTASVNTYGGTPLVFGCKDVTLTDCGFTNNVSEMRVRDGYGYPMVGRSYGGYNAPDLTQNLTVSGCVFKGNTNRAAVVTAASGGYALGLVGNGINAGTTSFSVTGTVFDGNAAEAGETVAGVTPYLSRGLLTVATTSGSLSHTFRNLTFTGPKVAGVYDVVQYGENHAAALKLVNSFFTVTDATVCEPFSFAKPALVTLENTTVRNMTAAYVPEGVTTDGLAADDILLSPTYQPLVRTPDLATVTAASGVSNRGAVQGVAQAAGTYALTVRCDPVTLGSVTPATSVAVGADKVTLTAVPAEGASLTAWKDAGGNVVSTSPSITVTASALGADTVYYAVFDQAGVTITYDLGAHATFDGTGLTNCVVAASPGRTMPEVPAFTCAPDYVFTGWLPALPSVVPAEDATYVAQTVSATDTRIVRFDANNASAGTKDGLTWATAYTSLADAVNAAKLTYSEIWVKAGVHKVSGAGLVLRDHMAIRGGYAGDDADDAARTDEPSVLDGNHFGSTRIDTMFDLREVACDETLVFDTLTMKNCSSYLIRGGAAAHPLVTNCTFTGYADLLFAGHVRLLDCRFKDATYPNRNFEILNFGTGTYTARVERCVFDGCTVLTRAPVTASSGVLVQLVGCTFTNCTSQCYPGNGIGAWNAFAAAAEYLEATDCRLVGNFSQGGGGAFYCRCGGSVRDTLFAHNVLHRYSPAGQVDAGKRTTDNRWFSLVPFVASQNGLRLERCTVVSNTLDCMGAAAGSEGLEATNRVALFTVTQPKALLVNNTVFANTVTVDKTMGGEASAYSASLVLFREQGAGALANNTFFENVAADGELLEKDRTSANPIGDWNNLWSADAALLNARYATWQGDRLAFPVASGNRRGRTVYTGVGTDANLYVKRGEGDYVTLPSGAAAVAPELGDPITDIFGAARPETRFYRGSSQQTAPSGLIIVFR